MVYLNLSNRSAPKCLQIGKTPQSTVLEINSDFDKVKHYGVEFPLQNMEVSVGTTFPYWNQGFVILRKKKDFLEWKHLNFD